MQIPYSAQTLSIHGPDALAFAQAQFSSNVGALEAGHWQFSAWLDARGRVRAFFHLARTSEDTLLMLLRGGHATDIAEGLSRFVFRSRLRIEAHAPRVLGTATPAPMHAWAAHADTLQWGCGDYALIVSAAAEPDDHWRLLQVRALWPWLPDDALDTWLPACLGLDALQATALDKGCYPGQEIVARLHYRGGNKRHLHRLRLSEPLPPGSVLRQGESDSFQLLDVVVGDRGVEALAVIHDETAVDLLQERHIEHEGNRLTVQALMPWRA